MLQSARMQGSCYFVDRFCSYIYLQIFRTGSRSSHRFTQKLVDKCSKQGNSNSFDYMLDNVSVTAGTGGMHDLFDEKIVQARSDRNLEQIIYEFDMAVACRNFSSIILGSSSLVELYDNKDSSGEFFLDDTSGEVLLGAISEDNVQLDEHCGEWLFLDSSKTIADPPSLDQDKVCIMPNSSCVVLQQEQRKGHKASKNESVVRIGGHGSSEECFFDKPLSHVSNLTRRQCHKLDKSGLHTLRKLLNHFPRSYADTQRAESTFEVGFDDGQFLTFQGRVLTSRAIKLGFSLSLIEVVVSCKVANMVDSSEISIDAQGCERVRAVYVHLKRYFRGARFTCLSFLRNLASKYEEGNLLHVSGKVKVLPMKDHYEMKEYIIDKVEEASYMHGEQRPYPIYPSKGGLKANILRGFILRALQGLPHGIDPIPDDIRMEFGLLHLHDAYMGIHHPKNLVEANLARKRLLFDDFFYLQLARLFQMVGALGTPLEKVELLEKFNKDVQNSVPVDEWSSLTKRMLKSLPYALTPSQLNAVSEIIWDLRRHVPMNRLLQGDVGCGKTVVAFLACMEVIGSGFQAAFMVPTEVLAVQHYDHLTSLLENMGEYSDKVSIALLTGSVSSKQSRVILNGLALGSISMVIGTHSLIADRVKFVALRIAVVDEQHRFGVVQRGTFSSKLYSTSTLTELNDPFTGKVHLAPHILALSATPIPRTLALSLYGDMSLTQITDLPPGRRPVETLVVVENESGIEAVYEMMHTELAAGGKIYVVYPVIEESQKQPQLHAMLKDFPSVSKKFEAYQCGLIHGRMKGSEKEKSLNNFRAGVTQILFSTQVIEIGVDVPDASMMIVMNAERYGIAQLHQLRGRVGRGSKCSKCILLSSTIGALDRLKVLKASSDGLYLALVDLHHRGPGDLLGKKQSGHLPEFPIARLEIDGNILQDAHLAALKVLSISHDLEKFPQLKMELSMRQPLCLLGD